MKVKKIIFLLGVSMLIFSCQDVMNKTNLESALTDDIWKEPYLTRAFMDKIIATHLPGGGLAASIATDDAFSPYYQDWCSDGYTVNSDHGWYYESIRSINIFLANIDKCTDMPEAERNDCVAQILYLRASLYFDMVKTYGGVPLIIEVQSLEDDLHVTRTKTSECITQILKDLDDAIAFGDDFPMKRDESEKGRINRAAAMVLKGRVLLHYASPHFSKETPAGTKSADVRWQEAYDYHKNVLLPALKASGFGLYRPDPASPAEAIQNRNDLFQSVEEYPNNPELIWVRAYQYPIATAPQQGIVDIPLNYVNAYPNADGTEYTGIAIPPGVGLGNELGINNAHFWKNRDPRFYVDIAYNGCKFLHYTLNGAVSDDLNAVGQMQHYWSFWGALDPYYDNSYQQDGGIAFKKYYDSDINGTISDGNHSSKDKLIMRYTEVLLNYAECAAKTGHEEDARQVLQEIRKRAGIPAGTKNYGLGTKTGDELILQIIKERQVELALEGFRFDDLVRWRLYTDELAGYKINGLVRVTLKSRVKSPLTNIDLNETPRYLKSINMDDDSYFDVFDNVIFAFDSEPFKVSERQYFRNISYEQHIKKNPKLEQTKLWEDGTFDPYQ